jgi:hypothetical protein
MCNRRAPGLTSVFNHDMMVYRTGELYMMNVSYWDGGYALLGVTDPTRAKSPSSSRVTTPSSTSSG